MKKINIKGPIVSNEMAEFYEWIGWDAACPNTLRNGLEEADGDEVVIEINSPGGVCIYGYEMYTMLKEYEGKTTAHVISAMSAATLLVCASDEALISDTGIFMIHNVQSIAEGDYRDMQMEADALREFNAGIINAYVRKTGKSREEIQALMDIDSYMSPQTAIEHGFVDGYMFGDPNEKKDAVNLAAKIVATDFPIIPEEKAKSIIRAIKLAEEKEGIPDLASLKSKSGVNNENPAVLLSENVSNTSKSVANGEVALVQPDNKQNIGGKAESDKSKKGGKTNMSLAELLAEDPEAKAELDAMIAEARAEGLNAERARMKSLDAIAGTVTAEALNDAKYGDNPIDGPALAYQAMVNGNKLAEAYMAAAKEDSKESGVDGVGIGTPDAGEEQTDEADEMAAYVNKTKGGK